jgi:hypothetical protein
MLPLREVNRARTQGVEAGRQPVEECRRIEQPGAGGGELDGEGQPVEPPADRRHRRRVRLGQGEVVADGPSSIDEQPHRGQRGQLLQRREFGERRHRQRPDLVLALGPQAEHRAAGGQHLELGAAGQQLVEARRQSGDLLEVVQHQQCRGPLEVLDQDVERWAGPLHRGANLGDDAQERRVGLIDRRQRHEHGARPVVGAEGLAGGDGQPGLADAAGAGEGDQADGGIPEQRGDRGDVVLPPDQRGRRGGE